MQIKLFTIFDVKADAYLPMFSMVATGLAIRTFADMAQDRTHPVGKHPEDYTLFEIGYFDDQDASIVRHETATPLGNAIEYIENPVSPNQLELAPTTLDSQRTQLGVK